MYTPSSHLRTSTARGASASAVAVLAVFAVISANSALAPTGAVFASDEVSSDKATSQANAMALTDTYLVTVTLDDRGDSFEFSTVTAMRHFSLAPPERRIRFRGRLWVQSDGRELLDFSVELGQQIAQKNGGSAVSSNGSWSGSAYVESGRSIKIVDNPDSSITVTLKKQ